jgi:uncharacterized membrane protein
VGNRWDTGRAEAFSDGVFAIAITLLVLDLRVPPEESENLWLGILREWPSYLGYVTSFATIGAIWLAHHALFRRLEFLNMRIMQLNLLLLLAVSFLPFPTRLMAEAIRDEDAERAAVVFYGLSLLVISLVIGALWSVVARDRSLLRPEVPEAEVAAILLATAPNIGFYVVLIALALLFPVAAVFGYFAIAVLLLVRARGDEPEPAAPA